MTAEDFASIFVPVIAILSIFVALPWLFLHYFSKARNSGRLSDDEERMLEDLWRSAKTMERRLETLERLIDAESPTARKTSQPRERGDYS